MFIYYFILKIYFKWKFKIPKKCWCCNNKLKMKIPSYWDNSYTFYCSNKNKYFELYHFAYSINDNKVSHINYAYGKYTYTERYWYNNTIISSNTLYIPYQDENYFKFDYIKNIDKKALTIENFESYCENIVSTNKVFS